MEAAKGSGKRILVVDDDQDVRGLIVAVLAVEGYLVTESEHGGEALSLFAPGRFDLVITDCDMPEMNGIQLINKIRALAPAQRIGMVSAHVEMLSETPAKLNFQLDKPFMLDDLRRTVNRVLELE